jgi:hypothetical protein
VVEVEERGVELDMVVGKGTDLKNMRVNLVGYRTGRGESYQAG